MFVSASISSSVSPIAFVNVTLPDGVVLLDGQSISQVKVKKSQPLLLEYTVIIEAKATGKIKADISVGSAQQVFFRARSQLSVTKLAPSSRSTQKADTGGETSPSFYFTERNGKKLRVYKLP